jgi:hypothetical protein
LASENLVSIITNESTITLLSLKGWAKGWKIWNERSYPKPYIYYISKGPWRNTVLTFSPNLNKYELGIIEHLHVMDIEIYVLLQC